MSDAKTKYIHTYEYVRICMHIECCIEQPTDVHESAFGTLSAPVPCSVDRGTSAHETQLTHQVA